MFQSLTKSFTKIFDGITSRGVLTESQITEAMRDIRVALLESDVALPVVKSFIESVSEKAKGQDIIKSVSPGQMVVKIIYDELVNILSASTEETKLNLKTTPPANILMLGLQGSGKTTASAKIALKLKIQHNKKVLLVSLDTYRPAAQEQLKTLADSINVHSLPIIPEESPIGIVKRAIYESKLGAYDVVIYDTAGRLHIDDRMIEEILDVKNLVHPTETLLVADAMIGQDSVNIASQFDQKVELSGVILSRIDGDSKGGAALSIRYVTGKAIKFLSTGEKLSNLEEFNAERLASRILDMGDVVSLVEQATDVMKEEDTKRITAKIRKGKFDFNDYLSQLRSIKKLGGVAKIINSLPGASKLMDKIGDSNIDMLILKYEEAIILSMTKKERRNPDLLNASRRKRIALGSGTSIQQVNKLVKQFLKIRDVMKKASKLDENAFMRTFKGIF